MDLYQTFSTALVTLLAVTLPWPLTIPVAALAYKVRQGAAPVPFEPQAYWLRSTFAALGLALLSGVLVGLAAALVRGAGFPAGPVHLVLLMAYLPVGVWYLFWMFALEDLVEGLGVFLAYLLLPGLPLVVIGLLTGWWDGPVRWLSSSS